MKDDTAPNLSPQALADRYGLPIETVYGWNKTRSGPKYLKIGLARQVPAERRARVGEVAAGRAGPGGVTRTAERRPRPEGGVPGRGNVSTRITGPPGYGLHIFPQHAALLEASAISPEVSRQRGYTSADTKAQLGRYGFESYQQRVPGLLIPLHRADGSVWGYQLRADDPRKTKAGTVIKYDTPKDQRNGIDIPPGIRETIGDPSVPLLVTEGTRKADSAVSHGLACVALIGVWGWRGTNAHGGKLAVADWHDIALNGRRVVLAFDSDVTTKAAVRRALDELAAYLATRGATAEYLHLPGPGDGKTGLDDHLAAEGAAGVWQLVRPHPPAAREKEPAVVVPAQGSAISGTPPAPCSLADAEKEYSRWLHDDDLVPTRAVLAAFAANMRLDGDPVRVMLVGGSGAGKTERIMPVTAMPNVVMSSTITGEAALLSATPKKDRADNATGGLLRQLGKHGMLVLKDFTSVLSMSRDARAAVLAALREVYDGRWDRNYGSDGGQTLTWQGKCGLLAGCTTAIDSAHSVLAAMGTRFVFVRLPRPDLAKISESALEHMGKEQQMRTGLAEVTAGLLANLPGQPHPLGAEVTSALVGLACLASQARSPVQRDWKGEIELVLDAEAPTRMIKQLGQLWRACGMLGLSQADSWDVVRRAGIDSVPKLRGSIIRHLAASDHPPSTTDIAGAVDHPTRSALRALEDLAAHGVVTRVTADKGHAYTWRLSDRARGWYDVTGTLPEMANPCTECGEPLDQSYIDAGFTDHGEAAQ